jgi:hypothetical protein|tara:strand:- start:320 stop:436 length:117 start_codon:yes stop_codon:yes gene_type:complete
VVFIPKRKGKLRKDEYAQTSMKDGKTRIRRKKKMKLAW